MDIGKLINIVRTVPKEKLKTDAGLREVLYDVALKSGKRLSNQELDQYVAQFRRMSKTESVSSLLNKMSKKGVKGKDIDEIKRRFKK